MIIDYQDFQEYANKLPEEFEEKVIKELSKKTGSKDKVERLVREFYMNEVNLTADISWVKVSLLDDILCEDVTHYQSYDVIKSIYFMKTFYSEVGETKKYGSNKILDVFRGTKDKNDVLFEIFTQVMGVIEYNELVDGKKKIVLVEKLG